MLDKEFLEILACPICKKAIREDKNELICDACRKAYPVRDGIPVMLIDKARNLERC